MKRRCALLPVFLAFAVLLASPRGGIAQFDEVGSINFPTSAGQEAQQRFLRGVAILHSFGWKQAREQFHAAQKIEPDFAMAYWGESLAYNHPLNTDMDVTEPRKTLERLGATTAERLAKAPTKREKGFLKAVEVLWGEGEHVERAVGYMEAMRDLHEAYPDDSEIAAFYSLSLLGAAAATEELRQQRRVMAGTIALKLFNRNKLHPGAAHYTIHSFDRPLLAPLALEAAYAFADIAPAVSHARHMPTHIFIQHGMWDRVSGNNQSAYDVALELWQPGDALGDAVHALDWGQYGDLQWGDYAKARLWMERLDDIVGKKGFGVGGERGASGIAYARSSVSRLKARYIVDTEEWEIRPVTEESPAHELLATALSAAHTGDLLVVAEAEEALGKMSEGSGYAHVMHKQVGALRQAAMGNSEAAIELMDEAESAVMAMDPPRGSANPVKPVHELYGELLLDLGLAEQAIKKFETSLLRLPNRPRSLLGLARARAANGEAQMASEAYAALAGLWKGRGLAGLVEAETFLAGADSDADR